MPTTYSSTAHALNNEKPTTLIANATEAIDNASEASHGADNTWQALSKSLIRNYELMKKQQLLKILQKYLKHLKPQY